MARRKVPSVETLLSTREIVIACGPGGVGKTTTAAAAAAMAAAHIGGNVLVLTVDPARRLADALGVKGIGNEVTKVPKKVFTAAGVTPRGTLSAAMLDTKQSWDALITTHAPDAETRDKILKNPLYQNITGRFVQSHDYIAMERLYELHTTGNWDLIVVDTPPTRNALDFLDAPERMADFFSSRLLRWLITPTRSSLVGFAARPFTQIADRILGTQFLADVTEFFLSLESMYGGFVERATAVQHLLADERTSFFVVSSSEMVPLREAEFFATELEKRKLDIGAVVLNKVLPKTLSDPKVNKIAQKMEAKRSEIITQLVAKLGCDETVLSRVLDAVGESFDDFAVVARRESVSRAKFPRGNADLVTVPFFDHDITDMAGLLELGESLLGTNKQI
jgi:anion-transporting  ArsA/GET3 family ATPase